MLHRESAEEFARQWAVSWNRRDIEAVLAHFHDDVVFTSPTALAVTGNAVVHGKAALRSYWTAAMSRIGSLHFTVERVLWDAQSRELAIVYRAAIDGKSRRVSENLEFDPQGKIVRAEVFHGVAVL
jgi:ketosteroid isomerase-like protein